MPSDAITPEMINAACAATILGEDEHGKPVHLEPREARCALEAALTASLAQGAGVAVRELQWEEVTAARSNEDPSREELEPPRPRRPPGRGR